MARLSTPIKAPTREKQRQQRLRQLVEAAGDTIVTRRELVGAGVPTRWVEGWSLPIYGTGRDAYFHADDLEALLGGLEP